MKLKYILVFTVAFFVSAITNSQERVWLDSDLKVTTKPMASYYRIGELKGKKASIFFTNGTIFRKLSVINSKKEGKFEEYYKSGNLKIIGKFKNDLEDGIWKTFYKNGKIKERGKYSNGEKVGVWKIFYKNI
ncbi:MAG: toxin-antitoxin system YwqK family antitoxin [Polaribacter sp.]